MIVFKVYQGRTYAAKLEELEYLSIPSASIGYYEQQGNGFRVVLRQQFVNSQEFTTERECRQYLLANQ